MVAAGNPRCACLAWAALTCQCCLLTIKNHELRCIASRCRFVRQARSPLLRLVDSRRLFLAGDIRRWPDPGPDVPHIANARRPQLRSRIHCLDIWPGRGSGHRGRSLSRLDGRPVQVARVGHFRRDCCQRGTGPVLAGRQFLAFSRDILGSLCRNDGGVRHDHPGGHGEPVVCPAQVGSNSHDDGNVFRRPAFGPLLAGLGMFGISWRSTLLYSGVFLCTLTALGCLVLRSRPEDVGLWPDGETTPPITPDFTVRKACAPAPSGPWSWAGWS